MQLFFIFRREEGRCVMLSFPSSGKIGRIAVFLIDNGLYLEYILKKVIP